MKFWYVLTKMGEELSVCGFTDDALAAQAWAAGDNHLAYRLTENKICTEGWNAVDDGDFMTSAAKSAEPPKE